ncbi:MAG TPA: hypothetical protein VLA96_08280 [Terriglobales bacterium]|nr:hypothetical protein [Terriglobales bacterium]
MISKEQVEQLRTLCKRDAIAVLTFSNGEVVRAKLIMIDDEYEDLLYDILETNRPDRYAKPLESSAYVSPWTEIESFTEVTTAG